MNVSLAALPIEIRAEGARRLIELGEDPLTALAAALFPDEEASVVYTGEPSVIEGECANGHLRTEENTYLRPNGSFMCRICARNYKRKWRRRSR